MQLKPFTGILPYIIGYVLCAILIALSIIGKKIADKEEKKRQEYIKNLK